MSNSVVNDASKNRFELRRQRGLPPRTIASMQG